MHATIRSNLIITEDDGPGWPLEHPSVLTWIHPGGGGCHRIEWITGALRGFPLSLNARSLSRSVCESVLRADDSCAFQVLTCGWEARMLFANWWPCSSSSESSSSVFSRADKTWVNFSYKAFCSESRLCFRASNSYFLRFGILLPDPHEMIGTLHGSRTLLYIKKASSSVCQQRIQRLHDKPIIIHLTNPPLGRTHSWFSSFFFSEETDTNQVVDLPLEYAHTAKPFDCKH